MGFTLIVSLLVSASVGSVIYIVMRSSIKAGLVRENEAKSRAADFDRRYTDTETELKKTLEEKGKFENQATRLEETEKTLSQRLDEIKTLNGHLTRLGCENATALKAADDAGQRADGIIASASAAHAAVVNAKDEQIKQQGEFILRAKEVLTTEFKALSADALQNVSDQLVKTTDTLIKSHGERTTADVELHKQQIKTMLSPVEETIKRLDTHVESGARAREVAEALLDAQVARLAGASESLSSALRKPVVRGSWGEMTLENTLGCAGLEAETDFTLQDNTDGEDGIKRTDAIINLPKGRKLIIDSKNLMESYLALRKAEGTAQQASLADAHSKLLRGHMKALSSKEYWKRYDGLDCVILFIPHDGMYHAAIKDEADLIRDACERRVFISNPMTLIPLLRALRYILDQERLNQSAEEISKVGAELYGELTRFAESMAKIGERIKATVNAYNDAIPGLDRYIVAKSRTLKKLGSAKGEEALLPDAIDLEPKPFVSRELGNALLQFGKEGDAINIAASAG